MSNQKEISTICNVRLDAYFTTHPNSPYEERNLSWGAKGILAYIISRPPNWKIHTWQLAKIYTGEARGNGLEAVKTMINELKEAGYIVYTKSRNDKGQWLHSYKTYSLPIEQIKKMFPQLVEPTMVEPTLVKPSITINNELPNNELSIVCVDPVAKPDLVPETPIQAKGSVCVESSLVAPPHKVNSITKLLFSGQTFTLSKEELYEASVKHKTDWTKEEIEEAWKVLENYSSPVRNWFKFIQGTILNKRKLHKIRELQECKLPAVKCPKKTKEKHLKNQQEISASEYLEKNTGMPLLREWLGTQKWSSK